MDFVPTTRERCYNLDEASKLFVQPGKKYIKQLKRKLQPPVCGGDWEEEWEAFCENINMTQPKVTLQTQPTTVSLPHMSYGQPAQPMWMSSAQVFCPNLQRCAPMFDETDVMQPNTNPLPTYGQPTTVSALHMSYGQTAQPTWMSSTQVSCPNLQRCAPIFDETNVMQPNINPLPPYEQPTTVSVPHMSYRQPAQPMWMSSAQVFCPNLQRCAPMFDETNVMQQNPNPLTSYGQPTTVGPPHMSYGQPAQPMWMSSTQVSCPNLQRCALMFNETNVMQQNPNPLTPYGQPTTVSTPRMSYGQTAQPTWMSSTQVSCPNLQRCALMFDETNVMGRDEMVERSFIRRLRIPEHIQKETIACDLDSRGHLIITGKKAAVEQPETRQIPINFKTAIKDKEEDKNGDKK